MDRAIKDKQSNIMITMIDTTNIMITMIDTTKSTFMSFTFLFFFIFVNTIFTKLSFNQ